MKAYRLEWVLPDGDSAGMYCISRIYDKLPEEVIDYSQRMCYKHSDYRDGNHPVPDHSVFMRHPSTKAAFRDMRQLMRWFGGYLPKLIKLGAKVVIYDIEEEDIVYGDLFQIMIDFAIRRK